MQNKKNSKNKIISKNNLSSNKKEENVFSSVFSKIGFFAPIIIFLVLTYTIGFLKWGIFYERNYLTVAILGAISILFSILLIKDENVLLNNFFINSENKKVRILLALNCAFILLSIIFSTYKYISLVYLAKAFLVLLFFIIGVIFSINEKFKSMFFTFLNFLSWAFTSWILLGITYITFFSGIKTVSSFAKFLASFSPGTMSGSLLSSIFGYPNTTASFIGSFIFITIFLFLKESASSKKYFQILKLFILCLGFLMTQSRAAFVILIACLSLFYFVYFFIRGGKSRKISFIILSISIIFLSLFLFAPSRNFVSSVIFPKTIQTNGEYSIQDRINLIKDGLIYFSKNPIIGTGLGTFEYNFPLYLKNTNLISQTIDPHSFLITELGEAGIIGTFLLFALLLLIFLSIFKKIKLVKPYYIPIIFAAVFGMLHSFVDWDWLYVLSLVHTILLLGFAYGNSVTVPQLEENKVPEKAKTLNLKFVSVFSMVMIIFCSYFLIARINYDEITVTGNDSQYFASKIVPYNADYMMLKARTSYMAGGNPSVVKGYLEKSIQCAKYYVIPWQSYTEFLISIQDSSAINSALKTVELAPYNYYSNFLLSKAYYSAENYDKAKEFAMKSIEIDPKYLNSRLVLEDAEIKLGNIAGAISTLKEIWDKDWGNAGAAIALSDAYGLAKDYQNQLYVLGTSFSTDTLSNNEEVATSFKKLAPAISLTELDDYRQITMSNLDVCTLNWKVEGANIDKASKIVINFEDIETKQVSHIADLDTAVKSYEFVLAPGKYKITVSLLTDDSFYKKALRRDILNESVATVLVNSNDTSSKISEGKALKLKEVALNNIKNFRFYYPAYYILSLLSNDEVTAYNYLEKAFAYQTTSVGNATIYNLINNFIQIRAFTGIREVSTGTHEPITLLLDKNSLGKMPSTKLEFYDKKNDEVHNYLGEIDTSNIKDTEYQVFLRTWNLKPGKHEILVYFSNDFISMHKLNGPTIVYSLEILNKDYNQNNINDYLAIVNKRIAENNADTIYLSYIRGYFKYTQKKYLECCVDLKNAYESDPTLTDAKDKYLSLFPDIKIKNVLYKDIYSDSPFMATWDVLRKDSIIGADQISFVLFNKKTNDTFLISRAKVVDKKIVTFNLPSYIPVGEYELITSYFGDEPYSKSGGEEWSFVTKTRNTIALHKENTPSNFGAETFAEAQKLYS
jgi:O-antigen ligase/tetratricopeptide (TPR) repeat protein